MKNITRTSARILAGFIAALLAGLATSAIAAAFIWDGTNNTWTSLHWNAGVGGPTGASNADSATINSGS